MHTCTIILKNILHFHTFCLYHYFVFLLLCINAEYSLVDFAILLYCYSVATRVSMLFGKRNPVGMMTLDHG